MGEKRKETEDIRAQLTKETGGIQNLDGIFTTVFRGYKKDEVRQYINAMAESARREKDSLQDTNSRLSEKIAGLQKEVEAEIGRYNELYNRTKAKLAAGGAEGAKESQNPGTPEQPDKSQNPQIQQENAITAEPGHAQDDDRAREESIRKVIDAEKEKLLTAFREKEEKLKRNLEKERADMQAEFASQKAALKQQASLERDVLNHRITDLENAVHTENEKYEALKEEYAAYSKKQEKTLADNMTSLRNTESLWDMEKQSASKLREQIAALRKELDDGEIAQLKKEIQSLDGKLSAAAEREKLQSEALKSMTLQKKQAEEKISDLRETLSAAEAKNDTLHLACIKAESYRETLEAEVTQIYQEMLTLKADKAVREAENG